MTYDTSDTHQSSFAHVAIVRPLLALCLMAASALLLSLPLAGATLSYDQASGSLTGFSVSRNDNPNTPNKYKNKTEVWSKKGYIARLLYVGEPTVFTFSNVGPVATGGGSLFYFTHTDKTHRWREFFLVLRAKGRYHNGGQHDYNNINFVIEANNGTYTLTEGAGDELVAIGSYGYDTAGNGGIYASGNNYKYRYKYSHIWIDTTMIHTANNGWLALTPDPGYYISNIGIFTANGLNLNLNLQGYYLTVGYTEPFTYSFGIDRIFSSPIPYHQIKDINSLANALEIATINYISMKHKARITVASDSGGIFTDFCFVSTTGETFPYRLAFKPTVPAANAIEITASDCAFESEAIPQTSPLGETTTSQRLEGKIKIFTPVDTTTPLSGVYSSTIYFIIEQI